MHETQGDELSDDGLIDGRRKYERPSYWIEEVDKRRWLKFPEDLVVAPHKIHPKLDPRHVWLIMRIIAQLPADHLGGYRVRATWSQLRNANDQFKPRGSGKKARAKSGYVSYDAIRKWARELKGFGLVDWTPGGRGEAGDRPSIFDLTSFAMKTLEVRRERMSARRGRT
jgi:hypothetical protein